MTSYKIYYAGRPQLGDPYELITAVFSAPPLGDPHAPYSDGVSVTVTFDTPHTPANLGPLVVVEVIPSP